MHNSQLLKTLATFDKNEWRSFRQFVRSPFFNTRADVVTLADYLAKNAGRPAADKVFSKKEVWKNTFPGADFDDKTLRYIMSHLLDAAEAFVAALEIRSDPAAYKLLVFNALRKRGLEKSATPHLIAAESEAESSRDTERMPLSGVLREKRRMLARQNRHTETPVREIAENFTLETVSEILREGCMWLDYQALAPGTATFPLLDAALDFSEKQHLPEHSPRVAVHYHACRMLEQMPTGGGEAHFFALKKLLAESAIGLSATTRREAWLQAINFAIRRQNQGKRDFGAEAFDLYKTGLETGVLLEDGHISKKAYTNALVLGLLAGDWDWAEHFLEAYRPFLPPDVRENTWRHSLATLHFKRGNFEKVLQTLQNVQFTDSMHNLDDRRLLLCSFYELGAWESLESLLDSFGIWLRRATTLGYHRDLYANLVKFTRRLMDLKNQRPAVRERLRRDIVAAKSVAAREWLLEKVEERFRADGE